MTLPIKTQHLLGAATFTRTNEAEAEGTRQVRVQHVRRSKDGRVAQWDCSSYLEFTYMKIDGTWKIGGWRPHMTLSVVGEPGDVIGNY